MTIGFFRTIEEETNSEEETTKDTNSEDERPKEATEYATESEQTNHTCGKTQT